jgi:hypothetical protein
LEYVESTPDDLECRFSLIIGSQVDNLKSDETLFIVLVGHGRGQDGALVLDKENNNNNNNNNHHHHHPTPPHLQKQLSAALRRPNLSIASLKSFSSDTVTFNH